MHDPARLAKIHAACFEDVPRPWTQGQISESLAATGNFCIQHDYGFALARVMGPEAELLTLAVLPDHRRRGIASVLLLEVHAKAREWGATESFLEVAATNIAARQLYQFHDYVETGCRKSYYTSPARGPIDAIVMSRGL